MGGGGSGVGKVEGSISQGWSESDLIVSRLLKPFCLHDPTHDPVVAEEEEERRMQEGKEGRRKRRQNLRTFPSPRRCFFVFFHVTNFADVEE